MLYLAQASQFTKAELDKRISCQIRRDCSVKKCNVWLAACNRVTIGAIGPNTNFSISLRANSIFVP
jgi:hypothetical protein